MNISFKNMKRVPLCGIFIFSSFSILVFCVFFVVVFFLLPFFDALHLN